MVSKKPTGFCVGCEREGGVSTRISSGLARKRSDAVSALWALRNAIKDDLVICVWVDLDEDDGPYEEEENEVSVVDAIDDLYSAMGW